MQEVKLLSEKQEILKGMFGNYIRLQSTATDRYYEKIIEEMKELEEQEVKRGVATCAENACTPLRRWW